MRTGALMLFMLVTALRSWSQNLNSVYSAYGIGDLELRDHNAWYGMGGAGVALSSGRTLNELNPASYAEFPSSRLLVELSLGGASVDYSSGGEQTTGGDFSIRKAALGFSVFKKLGASVGLKRYSSVNYLTTGTRYTQGSDTQLESTIEGSGGLYRAYWSNGYKLNRNLNLGVSVAYLFGSVNRKETILTSGSSGLKYENNYFYSNWIFNAGLQYRFELGAMKWTLGGTFQPGVVLRREEDNYLRNIDESLILEESEKPGKLDYPALWSAGALLQMDDWKFTVDYLHQSWTRSDYSGRNFTTRDARNVAGGFSYSFPRKTFMGWTEGITLSAGFVVEQSYLVIDGTELNSWAGTAGVSFPTKSGLSNYFAGLKVGQRGRADYPLVKEKFVECNFSISLASLLFTGGKKYYD